MRAITRGSGAEAQPLEANMGLEAESNAAAILKAFLKNNAYFSVNF